MMEFNQDGTGQRFIPGMAVVVAMILSDIRLMVYAQDDDTPPLLLLIVVYALAWLTIYLLLTSIHRVTRVAAEIVLFSAIYTDLVYLLMSAFPFSFPDAINITNNPGYAPGAISSFGLIFLAAFLPAGFCFILIKRTLTVLPKIRAGWVVPVNLVVVIAALLSLGMFDFFPAPYRVPGSLIAAAAATPEDRWERGAVAVPKKQTGIRDVVLIIDESISGGLLSINGYPLPTTKFLHNNSNAYTNFGIAGSYTNFSAGSNLALISGLQQKHLPDNGFTAFKRPSVYQFAKNAGYSTHLLDAQTVTGQLHNYTTNADFDYIDYLYQPQVNNPDLPVYDRDAILGNRLIELINDDEPSFIVINKAGAHWPYKLSYPPWYQPEQFNNDDAPSTHYLRAVSWSVDRFWNNVLPAFDKEDLNALVIYTADHGENHDAGLYQMRHASIYNATSQEGQVPLLLIDRAGFLPNDFVPYRDGYAHAQIFPTILQAMGYGKSYIISEYGESLIDTPPEQDRWFLTGDIFGRGKNFCQPVLDNKTEAGSAKSLAASTLVPATPEVE